MLIAALLALVVAPLSASAQGTVEVQSNSLNSIVRVWRDKESIVYNQRPGSTGQFLWWVQGASQAQAFDLPNDKIEVLDFEIIDDEAWFCGVYRDPTVLPMDSAGIVGKFNLADVFLTGGGTVSYTVMSLWIPSLGGTSDEEMYVRRLTRIDVFGDVEMGNTAALLGDVYLYHSAMYERVAVLSAYIDPTSTWIVHSTFPKDGRMVFTDIAVLDDMVVATGHGLSDTHPITKAYHKVSNFPCNPYNLYSFDSIYCSGYHPTGAVLTAHTKGNVMALAQFDKEPGTFLHVLEFSSTTGLPQLFTDSRITDYPGCDLSNCKWRLNELRYDVTTDLIHILERGLLPGDVSDESLQLSFPQVYSGEIAADAQKMTGLTQVSLDVDIDSHPITSGIIDASGMLDMHTFSPGGTFIPSVVPSGPQTGVDFDMCTYNTDIAITPLRPDINTEGADDICADWSFLPIWYWPDVYTIDINTICK